MGRVLYRISSRHSLDVVYYHKNTFSYVVAGRIQKTGPQLFVSQGCPCKEKMKCSNQMYRLICVKMKCTGWYIIVSLETMRLNWFEIMCE